jgi:septum formation protein
MISPSSISEDSDLTDPVALVEELALEKAKDVAKHHSRSLIIGSDTVVVHRGKILGKPTDEEDAIQMLTDLSGTTHSVYTGVAFVKTDRNRQTSDTLSFYEQTKVTFSTLDESDILAYVKKGSPMDKAGGYGIQDDHGALFVEKIEGDYYNVVGFPLNRFYRELKKFSPETKIQIQ